MAKIVGIIVGVVLAATGWGIGALGEEGEGLPLPEPTDADKDVLRIEGQAFPLDELSTHAMGDVDGKLTNIGQVIFYKDAIQDFVNKMEGLAIMAGPKYEADIGVVTRAWIHETEVRFEGLIRDSQEARQQIPFAECCIHLDFCNPITNAKAGELIHPESVSALALRLTRPGASGFPSTWVRITDNSKHAPGQPSRAQW